MARIQVIYFFLTLLSFSFASEGFAISEQPDSATTIPYTIFSVSSTPLGVTAFAKYTLGDYGAAPENLIKNLTITISYDNPYRVRVKITDSNNSKRWQVPNAVPSYTPTGPGNFYTVAIAPGPLSIKITRNSDSKVIFFLNPGQPFLYNDQDIGFANWVGYPIKVMGLGERVSTFVLPQGDFTIYARDRGSPVDYGDTPDSNLYSAQPFYMAIDKQFAAHGGMLLNSNAMTALVGPNYVGFRSTGGIIDYFAFIGPEPKDVIDQYHSLIGYPALVPFWGLGWHQCRYGYQNLTVVQNVTNNYMSRNIPLDAMWLDIDYMNQYMDFTVDPVNFPVAALSNWVHSLQILKKHFVPIVDAGIATNPNAAYTQGLAMNVFIGSAYHSGATVGQVWPGNAVFIDWYQPTATQYWINQLTAFAALVQFSGIWLDMNEASNFITGEVGHYPSMITNLTMPFTPGEDVNTRALDVASTHYGGILEYDVHSLYGHMEAIATNQYFTAQNQRSFIITRSTFIGTGRYAQKWTGDNYSQWNFLAYSITGIYNFNMFGIPFTGADICGFFGNTNEELCSRWMQLGTLYPFSRNHNAKGSIDQYPWSFGSTLLTVSNSSIRNKYTLMLHYSTGLFKNSLNGGMFFRPAFFDYPNDINLLNNATAHFMLGEGLIVHPCMWPGVTGTPSYFPYDIWYDFYNGNYVTLDYDNTMWLNMTLPNLINIHVRGGHIIPTLDNANSVLDVTSLRSSPITLLIALNGNLQANGDAVFDDGNSANTISGNLYTSVNYHFQYLNQTSDILYITPSVNGYKRPAGEFPNISNLVIYGCVEAPRNIWYVSQGVTTLLPAYMQWDPKYSVTRINLSRAQISPDQAGQFIINYYLG